MCDMYLSVSIRSVWGSQCSLSESDLLCMQLEYVKSVCHLDRCLVLPHLLSQEKGHNTPPNQSTKHTADHASGDPCPNFTHVQVRFRDCVFIPVCVCVLKSHSVLSCFSQACACKDEACACEDEMRTCEERVMMQVVAVQWDKVEKKNRVLETHSAMLTLQTLLMQTLSRAPIGEDLSHAIHTHSLVSIQKYGTEPCSCVTGVSSGT